MVAILVIWLYYPNKDHCLSILALLPLPTLTSLNCLPLYNGLSPCYPWYIQGSKVQMQSFHSCFGLVQPHLSNFRSGRWWPNNNEGKNCKKIRVLVLFSSAWILVTSDCRMPYCQTSVQGGGRVLTRSPFAWYCSDYISSNSIFKKYFEWENFGAYDCMYTWYSWWHRGQIPSPVIAECTAGREKWGTLSQSILKFTL